jgi:hypothetical protein
MEMGCFLLGPPRDYINRTLGQIERAESSVAGYLPNSNDVSIEAEESQLLKAVARERIVKTLQAGEDLVFGAVNCKMWKAVIVLLLFVVTTCKLSVNLFTNPNPSIVTHKS